MLSANGRILQLDGTGMTPVSGVRIDANGKPVREYTKDILRVGAVVRNTIGQRVTFTEELVNSILDTFQKMSAKGIRVPIQAGHNFDPELTRGYVLSLWRDGEFLRSRVEMIGEDGIALTSTQDVSVYVDEKHERDGTVFPNALLHVACTPVPQVTGLGKFAPIAASLSDRVFSTAKDGPTMDWKKIAALVGIDPTKYTDETGPAAVETAVSTLATEKRAIAASLEASKSEVGNLQLSVGRLSGNAPTVDQGVLNDLAEVTDSRLSGLVEGGHITPAQKDKFSRLFCGEKDKRPALCLSTSHATHAGLAGAIAASVIGILAEGKGKKLGEKTPAQGTPSAGDETGLSAADRKELNAELKQYAPSMTG